MVVIGPKMRIWIENQQVMTMYDYDFFSGFLFGYLLFLFAFLISQLLVCEFLEWKAFPEINGPTDRLAILLIKYIFLESLADFVDEIISSLKIWPHLKFHSEAFFRKKQTKKLKQMRHHFRVFIKFYIRYLKLEHMTWIYIFLL